MTDTYKEKCNVELTSQGLLNKQQQILEFLGTEKDKPRPKDYRFWFNQRQAITISNWSSLLREYQSSEIIDIWMKKDTPRINLHTAEGRRTTIRQPTFSTTDVDIPDHPGHVPIVSPFFEWDILDEFGESDRMSIPDRVESFLKAIYNRIAAEAQIRVERITETQIEEYLQKIDKNSPALALVQDFRLIFRLYIPVERCSTSKSVEMYWGAIHEIVQVRFPSFNTSFPFVSSLVEVCRLSMKTSH